MPFNVVTITIVLIAIAILVDVITAGKWRKALVSLKRVSWIEKVLDRILEAFIILLFCFGTLLLFRPRKRKKLEQKETPQSP